MSSQQLLLDIILALNTNKKKDRMGALMNLVDLLNQEAIIKNLLRNSKSKDKTISWDILFIRVHNAVLAFADENNSKSKQLSDKQLETVHKIVIQVVQKSVHNKILLIDPNLIGSSLMEVHEVESRLKILASPYLNLFKKYVMSERKNWCKLKEEYLIGVKNICLNCFKNPPQGVHSVMFLEMLIDVIRCSSKNCQISHNFLDLFGWLKNIYVTYKGSGSNFECILLRLTNTLCLQLAIEFRYKVCEFMENVFDFVIMFHEKKKPEKNILIYHFLMASLNIHNPTGVWDSKMSYAFNITKWESQIKEIFFLCHDELQLILKTPNEVVETDFLNLFIEVSHLVSILCEILILIRVNLLIADQKLKQVSQCRFEELNNMRESDLSFDEPGPSNKRRSFSQFCVNNSRFKQMKFDGGLNNILSNLQTPESWFWLKVLELVLHKYPVVVKEEFCQLVEFLYQLICNKKCVNNTKAALRCLCSFVKLQNSMSVQLTCTNYQWLDAVWHKTSIELQRFVNTELHFETHSLLRDLIVHSKLRDPIPFIKFYCNRTLKQNLNNFDTLCLLCQNYILPDFLRNEKDLSGDKQNCEKVRVQLLSWLLETNEKFPSKDLAKAVIALILKKFEEEIENSVTKEDILISQISINDFCKLITENYMKLAFENLRFLEDLKPPPDGLEIRLERSMKNKLFELLTAREKAMISTLSNAKTDLEALSESLWFCEFLCHLVSHFKYLSDSEKDITFLSELLKRLLFFTSTKSLYVIKTTFFDLSCYSSIYGMSFHQDVQKIIREPDFINVDFLKTVFELFTDRKGIQDNSVGLEDSIQSVSVFSQLIKNPKSILHFESLTEKEKLIVNAAEMLCQYVVIPDSSECNHYQSALAVKIMENLISDELLDVTSNFHLQLILRVVYNFSKHNAITISILNACLDFIEIIFDSEPSDFEIIITTLQVLKDLTALVNNVGDLDTRAKYNTIIDKFVNLIGIKKRGGVKAACKLVECLVEISKVDLDGKWAVLEKNGSTSKVCEEIINLLRHPHHEIRIMAAQNIGALFVFNKETKASTIMWQKDMLKKLFQVLQNSTGVYLKENVLVEYFDSVTCSVSLISWASIIAMSSYWRKKALFYLLRLACHKHFKRGQIEDIVKLICKELKISNTSSYISRNLPYLLYKWTKKKLAFEEFPFYLIGCTHFDEFIQKYFRVLVSIHSALGQINIFTTISSKLKQPASYLVKECHSELLAFILPALDESPGSEKSKKAKNLKSFIEQQVNPKISAEWLIESLDDVIFRMIHNMHDPSYLQTLCDFVGNVNDDKNSAGYSCERIVQTLKNLSTVEGKSLLGKIALEVPSIIEKILLLLWENVELAIIYEDRVFAFYKYIFFVEMVTKATQEGSVYCDINTFVIRDVVYSLTTVLLKTENETVTSMACECFKKLVESYLKEFSAIVGEFLPAITTALTPLVMRDSKKALEILIFLICRNYTKLETYVKFLDPFPRNPVFDELNEQIEKHHSESLKKTISHFIRNGNSKNSGCRLEGLKNLHKTLSKDKVELKEMYDELKMLRGFSEDCKKSLLHQLVCMLVELASDKNIHVQIEAANCLGELGPSDLTTLVLRPENNFTASKDTDPAVYRLIKSAISTLSDLLVNENFEVKKAASKALYAVLSTKQGKEILKTNTFANAKYLNPFVLKNNINWELNVKKEIFVKKLNEGQLWRPNNHEKWIVDVMQSLLLSLSDSNGVINAFIELMRVNWQFAESIFPVTLDYVLTLNQQSCCEIINKNISAFFEEYFDHRNKSATTVSKTSVQCMINVVDYIRIQRNNEGFYQEFDLSVNYLHVAKAALYCSAYFTSIFYAELWFQGKRIKNHHRLDINAICEQYPEEGFALTETLRECHFKIGNSDGIHGCGYMHILDTASEIQHYEHQKNWSLSMLHHDIRLSQGHKNSEYALLHSLERFGMFYTLSNLIKNHDAEIASIQYQCAARLLNWSLLDSTKTKNDGFDTCYYLALKAFHDEDESLFQNEIHKARKTILSELAHCSLESSKNLYLPLSELQSLKELEEFSLSVKNSNLEQLFKKWECQDEIKCSEFKLVESILANRSIMIKDKLQKTDNLKCKNCLQMMLSYNYYKLTKLARKEKKFETAIRTLCYLGDMKGVPEIIAEKMKIEKARILWERGDTEIGKFLLSYLLKRNEITGELKSKSLRIYGDWMAKTKSENSREIIENYYLKSIAESNNSRKRIHSFASLAKFADSHYEQLHEYLSSPLFEIKQNLISTQQDLACELRQELGWNQNREKRMAYHIASKQSAIDVNEIKNSKEERDSYLNLALKYYLLSLKEGEDYNLVVFRVISLWLSNANNPEVIQQLQKLLHHIPTYKFLCLLPQLVPRMADVCLISDLIEEILQDHPHHTLPLIFALKNSYEDLKYNGVKTTGTPPRILTAKSMLEKFQSDRKLNQLIVEMHRFSSAFIELANFCPYDKAKPGTPIVFKENLQIKNITNLSSVPVPSIHIPYNKNGEYNNIISIHKFEESFNLVGGVNMPKRVVCIGSDGISRPLLIKGRDDLRQDAVMQQVFTIMNSLLYQNLETNKRKLVIRTYKVVPLSQRSGIIEWCENTQPLSMYLTGPDGKSGAHKKFYPQDASALDCRIKIKNVFAQPSVTNEDKLKVFLSVCKEIQPVFHYFFIEKFPAAGVWFERRLAYTHSVATSSMIGYILGIGDRHVNNILIDNTTAEVIHIDLGIAFEQGKTLPTPETVPFRLTRDIVDGMALSGIEGDFRISCIKTMEVLRENQDTILTLLEVLLYDPLYAWTITPEKAYSIQNHTESSSTVTEKSTPDLETNKMAERALIRLKQKLQGAEAGFGATNVEGQVNYLFQQARDPNNLCRLFHGWQAFL